MIEGSDLPIIAGLHERYIGVQNEVWTVRRLIDRHLPTQPSPIAPGAWAAWAFALAIGSLFPITSWTERGLDPLAFLTEPWPRWWTSSDVLLNVLAYVPFGLFGALATWPRAGARRSIGWPVVAGFALSLSLEALQNWLPSRIPSRLDVLANGSGALIGAVAGALLAPWLIGQARLNAWFGRWFAKGSYGGWLLLTAWILSQLAPQSRLFSAGELQLPWSDLGTLNTSLTTGLTTGLTGLTAAALLESLTVIAALVTLMLIVTACTRSPAPRAAIAGAIVLIALAGRTVLVNTLMPEGATDHWASAGALGGLLCGALLALGASTLRERGRRRALVAAVLTLLLTGPIKPELAFQNSAAMAWSTGSWRNVAGFQHGIASLWPALVLVWGLRRRL